MELLPRLLGCRHSVCSSCLPKVCGKDNSITCPLCRHVTPVPSGNVGGLLKDLRQVAFLEGPLQGNQQPHVCELCEDQHEATFTCIDCPPQVSLYIKVLLDKVFVLQLNFYGNPSSYFLLRFKGAWGGGGDTF